MGISTVMLSGDKSSVVQKVAKTLGIDSAFGDLLPEGKVERVMALKNEGRCLAFVGDGVNDAPVVALADAGIAMGGLGSDATIETADIVIQNDQPSKIPLAVKIGKLTRRIVWQNIILAMTVKAIVLVLGAGGLATLWEAVFADVGVALLAILNAVRVQRHKFYEGRDQLLELEQAVEVTAQNCGNIFYRALKITRKPELKARRFRRRIAEQVGVPAVAVVRP